MPNVTIDFNANLARFSSQIDKATNDLSKFQSSASRMEKNFNRIFKGLGTLIPTGLFLNFTKHVIDLADDLKDMSERTGIAIETLAGLKGISEDSGASLEDLATSMKYLAKNMDAARTGDKELQAIFDQLQIKGSDLKENFFQLADQISRMPDGQDKLALSMKLLGRSGEALIPTLNLGGKALREMDDNSRSFAERMAKLAPDADKFNEQMRRLKDNIVGAAAGILSVMLPALDGIVARFTTLAAIGSAGGLTGLFAGVSGNISHDLPKITAQIRVLEKELAYAKSQGGYDPLGDVSSMEEKLAKLKSVQTALREISMQGALDLAQQQYKRTPSNYDSSALNQARCEAKGGIWDGKSCQKRPAKSKDTDPLKNILSQTDTAKIAEITKQINLLTDRFTAGKVGPQQYAEAMVKLRNDLDQLKNAKDAFGDGSFISIDPETIKMIQDQQSAINDLNGEMAADGVKSAEDFKAALDNLLSDTTISKTENLYKNIAILDKAFFDGVLGAEQYNEAIKNITSDTSEKLKKTKSVVDELGLTFSSAFEDAVVGGKKFRDILAGIAQDIARIVARKTLTEPLGNALGGLLGSIDWGGLFGFANGGVMTSKGPMNLRRYAAGGIVNSPQFFVAGEGSLPEAQVPLPDGRSIPVTLSGSTGGGVQLVQNIMVDARGADAGVEARIRQAVAEGARQGYAMVVNDLSRGGPVARLTGAAST